MATSHDWDAIREALGFSPAGTARVWLSRNYRIPPVIHERAERLRRALTPDAEASVSVPWHPHAGRVRVAAWREPAERDRRVASILEGLERDGITAIVVIAGDEHAVPTSIRGRAWQRLDGREPYRGGLAVARPEDVRGLEFDALIVPDAGHDLFPAGPEGARRLYTCLTRARRCVDILAGPDVSPWVRLLRDPPSSEPVVPSPA
jgi:DNA helicase IV